MRFVWTVWVALVPELKPARASDDTTRAAVNDPASAARRRPRRSPEADDIRLEDGYAVVVFAPPDSPQNQHHDDCGQEIGRNLMLARRAQPQNRLPDPGDGAADGPHGVAVEHGGPGVGRLVRIPLRTVLNVRAAAEYLNHPVALEVVVADRNLVEEDVPDPQVAHRLGAGDDQVAGRERGTHAAGEH